MTEQELKPCPWCNVKKFKAESQNLYRHPDNECWLRNVVFTKQEWNNRRATEEKLKTQLVEVAEAHSHLTQDQETKIYYSPVSEADLKELKKTIEVFYSRLVQGNT